MSKRKLTKTDVARIMRALLKNFATKKIAISNDTLLSNVLGKGDGHAMDSSSDNLFKSLTKWSIARNGGDNRRWPNDWLYFRVDQLAEYLMEV